MPTLGSEEVNSPYKAVVQSEQNQKAAAAAAGELPVPQEKPRDLAEFSICSNRSRRPREHDQVSTEMTQLHLEESSEKANSEGIEEPQKYVKLQWKKHRTNPEVLAVSGGLRVRMSVHTQSPARKGN